MKVETLRILRGTVTVPILKTLGELVRRGRSFTHPMFSTTASTWHSTPETLATALLVAHKIPRSQWPRALIGGDDFPKGSLVHVAGIEWPGTEWDVPDAWYPGEITGCDEENVYVHFDDEEDHIPFTREMMHTYKTMYQDFRMRCLTDVCDLLANE